ncbi:hypothetical protein Gotri_006348, partial [Gossypium trilobum]|nr:hypothetical protein [Gossypium trilobum]
MEAKTANMSLEDKEEESIPCEREPNDDDEDRQFRLVGRALTDCIIHFLPFKRTMMDLWHPLGGTSVNFPPIEYRRISKADPIVLFLFLDPSSQSTIWREQRYMRFTVKIDVRLTLKRKKKAKADKRTRGLHTIEIQEVIFGRNLSLRAPSRNELLARSIWLIEELPSGIKKGNSSVGMELYGRRRRRID